jgi:hypothetical protein
MPLAAVLDANAIWSAALRDTLLRAAEAGLYSPLWTARILEEMARSLKEKRPDLSERAIDRTVARMLSEFNGALIEGYEHLIPVMQNNEGDRHVLAAAVHTNADVIITWNLRHFPEAARAPYGIRLRSPDEFLCLL